MLLYKNVAFTIHGKIHTKISASTWNEEFESYSISDSQDYCEYILNKHRKKIDNLKTRIYVSKIENRITFRIKTWYHLETPETMKLFGSTKNKINKDKNGGKKSYLEITET